MNYGFVKGFSSRHRILLGLVARLVREGVLQSEGAPLQEGRDYVRCRECGIGVGQILASHLRSCSGLSPEDYRAKYPDAPFLSERVKSSKTKTPEQKLAQSEKLKARFRTPEGEETRRVISEASKKMQTGPYGEKAAKHLREIARTPEHREKTSRESKARWDSGSQREIVEGWHRDHREESLAGAAKAREALGPSSGPHLRFKAALEAAGLLGFRSEYPLGYFHLDEALPERKIAVEVDGCYWHGCAECGFSPTPYSRKNDRQRNSYLRNAGWTVVRVWEHEVNRSLPEAVLRVRRAVEGTFQEEGAVG